MAELPPPTGNLILDTGGARILVVDDDDVGRELTAEMLRLRGYTARTAANCREGMGIFQQWSPDLALLDVVLPDGSGIEMCRQIKADPRSRLVPVMLVTGMTDHDSKIQGIEAGADDFLNKPVDPPELFARAESLIKLKRYTDELDSAEDVLLTLAMGIEARDKYTQGHCQRLSTQAAALGQRLGLPPADLQALRRGGVLHDIGKIAVPDAILRKTGGLTEEEWTIMRLHPSSGEEICRPLRSMVRVLPIIRHHHEHWDGGGYPDHLAGENIPLLARILQIVDAYDALITERPYKLAWPPERARQQLLAEAQHGWWDPRIMSEYMDLLAASPPPADSSS